jgi:uncharacterized protein with HEPN domain
MKAAQRDSGYLADMQTAIAKIDRYTKGMALDDFMSDELVQDAVLRNIAIIGEAVSKLSDSLTGSHPEVPWRNIAGMRNRLVHDYNGVNLKLVWNTIKQVIPGFLATVQALQAVENDGGGDDSGGSAPGGPAKLRKPGSSGYGMD